MCVAVVPSSFRSLFMLLYHSSLSFTFSFFLPQTARKNTFLLNERFLFQQHTHALKTKQNPKKGTAKEQTKRTHNTHVFHQTHTTTKTKKSKSNKKNIIKQNLFNNQTNVYLSVKQQSSQTWQIKSTSALSILSIAALHRLNQSINQSLDQKSVSSNFSLHFTLFIFCKRNKESQRQFAVCLRITHKQKKQKQYASPNSYCSLRHRSPFLDEK